MGCLIVCGASFLLATILVVVSLCLPVWYEETWPDFNQKAFTKANLWRVCYYYPNTSDADLNAEGQVDNGTETCVSAFDRYDEIGYFNTHTVIVVLVGCGLGLGVITVVLYLIWMCHKSKDVVNGFRVRKEGAAAGVFGLLAGGAMLAADILFMETLQDISQKGEKRIAFWLNFAGAILQCFLALMTIAFIIMTHREATKSPDVDIMMHSAVPTIEMVDEPGRFSRA